MANNRYQVTLTETDAARYKTEGQGNISRGMAVVLVKLDAHLPTSQKDRPLGEDAIQRRRRIEAEKKADNAKVRLRDQMITELEQHDSFGRFSQSTEPQHDGLADADPHEYFADSELAAFHATYLELTAAHRESIRQADENTRRHAYNQAHGIVTTLRTASLSVAAQKQLGVTEAPVNWTDAQITEYNEFCTLSPSEQLRVLNDEN